MAINAFFLLSQRVEDYKLMMYVWLCLKRADEIILEAEA